MNTLTRSKPAQRRILSYLDHSDPRLAKTKGLQFEAQEELFKDKVDISSVGRMFKDGDTTPAPDKALMVIGGILGVGAAVASIFAPLQAKFVTVPLAAFFLKNTFSGIKESITRKKYDQSNLNFKGSRTWDIQGQDKIKANIDSPLVGESDVASPSREDLSEFVDTHSKTDTNEVLVFHGHGHPGVHARVGALPISDVDRVLTKRLKDTGFKTGLIVLDSCQLGNLSVLKAMEGKTDYLVASEADIDIAIEKDPNTSFTPYPALAEQAKDNRELAHKVVDQAKGMSTLAAYDMNKAEALFESLDQLGTSLTENHDRRWVKKILDEAHKETVVSTQSQSSPSVVDLGAFCKKLKAKSPNSETKKFARDVLKAMDEMITKKKASGRFFESSHISFHNPDRMYQRDRNQLLRSKLPEGWKNFLRTQITQKTGR